MRRIRNFALTLILTVLCALLLRGTERSTPSARLWVGGVELTGGGSLACGGGIAAYDPLSATLTLTDAEITGDFRGAAIYAEQELTLVLRGENRVSGLSSGCTALGGLTVSGEGSLVLTGRRSGAAVRGCVTVFDSAALLLQGDLPLRWGRLHVSPMDTVLRAEGSLRVCAPYSVLLTDGLLDAAGHLLRGEAYFRQFQVKLLEPVPEPEAPEKSGYRFDGWFADASLTAPFDFTEPYDGNVVLYARWVQLVTLQYDSWGGSPVPDGQFDWGTLPQPGLEPEREGWRFVGWYADEELAEPFDWLLAMTEPRTAYAKWEKLADRVLAGIDAARYQGEIDWDAVRDSGRSFAFLRIGYRGYGSEGTLNPDDNFAQNYRGAIAAGMDVGVYIFSQATNEDEAREEARFVLEQLGGRALGLPVVLDYELATNGSGYLGRLYDAGLSGEEYAAVCLAFCEEIEAGGYTAAVYAGQSMLRDCVGQALEAAGYPVWLAHWTVQTRYNGSFDFWQYSGSGHVPGIDPETDLDYRYVTAPGQVSGLKLSRGEGYNFLYWDRIPGVQGYVIYRKAPETGEYTEIGRKIGASNVVFTDYGGEDDWDYAVAAYLQVEGQPLCGPLTEPAAD